jgi:hypothetical protein
MRAAGYGAAKSRRCPRERAICSTISGTPSRSTSIARSANSSIAQLIGTKGELPSASEWPGYRAGQNREGAGLNVAEELRQPRRLASGDKYDVLVAERHDLPAIARKERTAFYVTDMAKHLLAGNPDAEVLLYHTWLHVDPDEPWPWIDYERAVSPMWECIASRANLDLPARGDVPRVRVLPGGSALAGLAGALWDGKVPGVAARAPEARLRLLFSDNVHMSDVGRYYMALVHMQSSSAAALKAPQSPNRSPRRWGGTCRRWRGNLLRHIASAPTPPRGETWRRADL